MKMRMNPAISKMSAALDCDYLFALGLFLVLDEMAKAGEMGRTIDDRFMHELGFMSTKMSRILSTKKGGQIWDIYGDAKVDMLRDKERDKKRDYRERKRSAPSFPPSPAPLSPLLSPQEKERGVTPPIPPKGGERVGKPPEITPGFVDFWTVYPRKVSKQTAIRAWRKTGANDSEALTDTIIADVNRRLKTEWSGKDMQYIPHPSTYLNQRRWEDETASTERTESAPKNYDFTDEDWFV